MAHSSEKSARFKREQYFPQDWSSITAEFLALFHRYAYICKPIAGGDWFSANENWALTDSEILKAVAGVHPKYIVGCRSGRATRYAVLDIDTESKYHNLPAVDALRDLLRQAGVAKTVVYRSSDSGGWHLYVFFDEAVSSKDLSGQLNQLLKLNNFEIKKGTLEIFPQPGAGSNGQGLRLPLQQGFAWLDQKTLEIENERFEYSAVQALELLIDALNGAANTRHHFHQMKAYVADLSLRQRQDNSSELETVALNNVVPLKNRFSGAETAHPDIRNVFQITPPGIIAKAWLKGRDYYSLGLTGPSQRADAIFCLGHYLFYGDPERQLPALGYGLEQERRQAIETILANRHHGHSRDLNRDRVDALKQIERATSWVPPSRREGNANSSKFEMPISWVRHNANLKVDARSKITAAVQVFLDLKQTFSTRDLSDRAGCSRTTLYKHQDLWKEAYDQLNARLFASGPHEYNAVADLVSSETSSVLPTAQEGSSEFDALFHCSETQVDEFSYRRESKRVQLWIQPLLALMPQDCSNVDTSQLLFLIPTFNWFLSNSPTITCTRWLSDRIKVLRVELEARLLEFRLVHGEHSLLSCRDINNRYLGGVAGKHSPIARRLCSNRLSCLRGQHPPPV